MVTNRLETERIEGLWPPTDIQRGEEIAEDAKLPEWLHQVEHYLVSHPRTLLIAAVAVGITLGWLGKRK